MNNEKLKAQALDTLNRYLQSHHLRKTTERYTLLDQVLAITGHFTIDTLLKGNEQQPIKVSRATVYNTVDLLVDAGIIRRISIAGQATQYEVASLGHANHLHLVCSQCGKVREVTDVGVERLINARRYETFHPEYFALNIYGVCSRCQRKKRKKRASAAETRTSNSKQQKQYNKK